MHFNVPYNDTPVVLITANHSTGGGNVAPTCNGISSWVEVSVTAFLPGITIYFVNSRSLCHAASGILEEKSSFVML